MYKISLWDENREKSNAPTARGDTKSPRGTEIN